MVYFQFQRIRNDCENLKVFLSFWSSQQGLFDLLQDQKKSFLELLKVILELFRSCTGIFLTLKGKVLLMFYYSCSKFNVTPSHFLALPRNCIGLKVLLPLGPKKKIVCCWWGIYLSIFVQFFFFLLLLGETFNFLFQIPKSKKYISQIELRGKIDTFCQVDIRDLTFYEVQKVVFWTFFDCWEKFRVLFFFF